ncbi:MAG: hypothetical protein RMX96_05575 [Nostoc sp. ChiSLP02]|nr:hypothetical protein [Nostoc sp. DedSLP05]MDZ8103745.1 hypothetical protein [Nostoc sp. DedSLP01]MDZ8184320.1 hypothetical protein [Nostoc sp. ChiSLP02]
MLRESIEEELKIHLQSVKVLEKAELAVNNGAELEIIRYAT